MDVIVRGRIVLPGVVKLTEAENLNGGIQVGVGMMTTGLLPPSPLCTFNRGAGVPRTSLPLIAAVADQVHPDAKAQPTLPPGPVTTLITPAGDRLYR